MSGRKELLSGSWPRSHLGKGTSDGESSSFQGVPRRCRTCCGRAGGHRMRGQSTVGELKDAWMHFRSVSHQAAEHACVRGSDFGLKPVLSMLLQTGISDEFG